MRPLFGTFMNKYRVLLTVDKELIICIYMSNPTLPEAQPPLTIVGYPPLSYPLSRLGFSHNLNKVVSIKANYVSVSFSFLGQQLLR